jgi:hypothetical protein
MLMALMDWRRAEGRWGTSIPGGWSLVNQATSGEAIEAVRREEVRVSGRRSRFNWKKI